MNKKIPNELHTIYEQTLYYFLHEGPFFEMDIEKICAKNIMGYGISKEGVIKNFTEFNQLSEVLLLQEVGMESEVTRRLIHQHLSVDGTTGIFVEEFSVSIKTRNATQNLDVWLSCVFELIENDWKLVHFHTSVPSPPDNDFRDINGWKQEKEKLEKKVAEQAADLQQKSRELDIEAAVERVRAHAMGMKSVDDLKNVIQVLRQELTKLDLKGQKSAHIWLENEDGTITGIHLDLRGIDKESQFFETTFDPQNFKHFFKKKVENWKKSPDYDVTYSPYEDTLGHIHEMATSNNPIFVEFSKMAKKAVEAGMLVENWSASTGFGSGMLGCDFDQEPDKWAEKVIRRMGSAFGIAYHRFEDLQEAEKQALLIREERDRLEIALRELSATQDQLIQQEKLASLGQLTAGIAHEIKNPLNFVNNFSDVSIEMIDEAIAEVKAQDLAPLREEEIIEILSDIKSNLAKIHEHGSRADGIVKSMLQHSRGGSGKMEPTDLNALIEEYVNLAFHGMRAGKNPINVDIQLDLDDSIEEVDLVGEDFSRVILNLCSNAFDAMGTVKTQGLASLYVRTKKHKDTITIEIEDNGPGIPNEIKDKILQPFFTTKKGIEGTGLGLSITNDIVKAHGGEMDFESKPGKTIFEIILFNQL